MLGASDQVLAAGDSPSGGLGIAVSKTWSVVSKDEPSELKETVTITATFPATAPDTEHTEVDLTQNTDGNVKFKDPRDNVLKDSVTNISLSKASPSIAIDYWGRTNCSGKDKKVLKAKDDRKPANEAVVSITVMNGCVVEFSGEFVGALDARQEQWRCGFGQDINDLYAGKPGTGNPAFSVPEPAAVIAAEGGDFSSKLSFKKGDNLAQNPRHPSQTWETKITSVRSVSPSLDLQAEFPLDETMKNKPVKLLRGMLTHHDSAKEKLQDAGPTGLRGPQFDFGCLVLTDNGAPISIGTNQGTGGAAPAGSATDMQADANNGNHLACFLLHQPVPPSGGGAEAEATIASGNVTAINVIKAGTGYASAPAVSIEGGGGMGAAATAAISATGAVTGITVTNAGTGYTEAPRINFSKASPTDYSSAELNWRVKDRIGIHDPGWIHSASCGWASTHFEVTSWDNIPSAKLIYAAQQIASTAPAITPANKVEFLLASWDCWKLKGKVNNGQITTL